MDANFINEAAYKSLSVNKLFNNSTAETILITLEKGAVFPEHTSPKDTLLVVLTGAIDFYIEGKVISLSANQLYSFKKEVPHHVIAIKDSKFLIIR